MNWRWLRNISSAEYLLRVVLSATLVWVLLAGLGFARLWFGSFGRANAASPNLFTPSASPQFVSPVRKLAMWPEFPHAPSRTPREMVVNGVKVITDEWETTSPASAVFAYYREQMNARGWRDVTEATYGFQPEAQERDSGLNRLQDEDYLRVYRTIMDSELELVRGGSSFHVSTVTRLQGSGGTRVRLMAAAAPSTVQYAEGLAGAMMPGNPTGISSNGLDFREHTGARSYHTVVRFTPETPAVAFETTLARLRAEKWRPIGLVPVAQRQMPGYFAWLVKEKLHAAVSVSGRGFGSAVTFTEITGD